jgi:hypothetical protein
MMEEKVIPLKGAQYRCPRSADGKHKFEIKKGNEESLKKKGEDVYRDHGQIIFYKPFRVCLCGLSDAHYNSRPEIS